MVFLFKFLRRFVDMPSERDGQLVAAMKEMGAIPFCLTNIPQTMKVCKS